MNCPYIRIEGASCSKNNNCNYHESEKKNTYIRTPNSKKRRELKAIHRQMRFSDMTFYQARQYVRHGYTFQCEMRYTDCELRGYCNGDC